LRGSSFLFKIICVNCEWHNMPVRMWMKGNPILISRSLLPQKFVLYFSFSCALESETLPDLTWIDLKFRPKTSPGFSGNLSGLRFTFTRRWWSSTTSMPSSAAQTSTRFVSTIVLFCSVNFFRKTFKCKHIKWSH
jgi:hypothetical protein